MIWVAFAAGFFLVFWVALSAAGTAYALPVALLIACVGVLVVVFEDRTLR